MLHRVPLLSLRSFSALAACLSLSAAACFTGSTGQDTAEGGAPDASDDSASLTADAAKEGEASSDATAPDAADASGVDVGSDAAAVDDQASAPDVEASLEATDDGALEAEASADDGAAEATAPFIDAGAGCIPPSAEAPLSPDAEGLPSSGLVLWLRADRGVYMTAADRVCAWADQSPNAFFFTATGGAQPLFLSAGDADAGVDAGAVVGNIGGQASVYFDGAGSAVGVGGVLGIPAASGRTFIAVTRMVNPAGRFHSIIMGESGSAGTYVMLDANTWETAGNLEGLYVTNNSYDTALATSVTSRVHVYTISTLADGEPVTGNVDYRINGATQTLTLRAGSGSLASFDAANFTAIGDVDTTSSVGQGGTAVVAEVIAYDRALDVGERMSVESALMTRYGIQ